MKANLLDLEDENKQVIIIEANFYDRLYFHIFNEYFDNCSFIFAPNKKGLSDLKQLKSIVDLYIDRMEETINAFPNS